MRRREFLVVSAAILAPSTGIAQVGDASAPIDASLFVRTLNEAPLLNRMLLTVDALRLNLFIVVSEGRNSEQAFAGSSAEYIALRNRIRSEAPRIAKAAEGQRDALRLPDDIVRIATRTQQLLAGGGVQPGSKLGSEMFEQFRLFLKAAELTTDGLRDWLCRDYPFKAACG